MRSHTGSWTASHASCRDVQGARGRSASRQSLNAALNGFSQLTASTIPRPLGFDPLQQLQGTQVRDGTH